MQTQECERCCEILPWYVSGQLEDSQRTYIEQHLLGCGHCQLEMRRWQHIAAAIHAEQKQVQPVLPFHSSWETFRQQLETTETKQSINHTHLKEWITSWWEASIDLTCVQLRLVSKEFWILQLLSLVIAGLLICVAHDWSGLISCIAYISSFIAAISMVVLCGEHSNIDKELTLTTRLSVRVLLSMHLALLVILQGVLITSIALFLKLTSYGGLSLLLFVGQWLAPLSFLVAMTLLISTLLRPFVALVVVACLWILRLLAQVDMTAFTHQYEQLWQSSSVLFILAILAVICSFLLIERREHLA